MTIRFDQGDVIQTFAINIDSDQFEKVHCDGKKV